MRVHVDETGYDEPPGRVNLVRPAHLRVDRGNAAIDDADVSAEPGTSSAVDDRAASNGEVDVGSHDRVRAGTSNP